jgi:hypothetical protein
MRVTFDSNVWENLASEEASLPKPYSTIKKMILNNRIEPYFCEISLSLESITKKDRLIKKLQYQPKTEFIKTEENEGSVTSTIEFSPNNDLHPGMPEVQKSKFHTAIQMGFKVLPMTNLGTARAREILPSMKKSFNTLDNFWSYAERLAECSEFITSLNCGFYQYQEEIKKYRQKQSPYLIIKEIKESKKFAKAVAEWADADAISAHYANNNDYFCTNDHAGNAGNSSALHTENRLLLRNQFGIQIITPIELADKLLAKPD